MISHLWDTDMLTLYQRGQPKVTAAPAGSQAISVVSVEEQFLGWYTAGRQTKSNEEVSLAYDSMTEFADFIKRLAIASFGEKANRRYRQIQALKLNVPKKGLRIAAITADELGVGYFVFSLNPIFRHFSIGRVHKFQNGIVKAVYNPSAFELRHIASVNLFTEMKKDSLR
jgi:hypothetical protein